ncbi:winged helix-turn-helix transcriptional regulator [Nocardioides speluncae]|uniref:winged helix-turn-helix transcriptional regulator n=1 Tax=Nocardioides speluncae TaxID=2670337 RepID=UPI0019814462|nr:winged helix-turn-helix transcriptional regulator [Nocardioides speluncae]
MTGSMRTYGDGCTSAHALDVVGERWALLIVRDLLFGPKRFTDLRVGLPQGSPNVLSQRLRELEESGVVRRRKLPAPASAMVYELTEWGAELEPVLLGLQRWGAGSPAFAHDVPLGCDAAMLALRNAFDPETAGDLAVTVEVRFETATFRVQVADGALAIARGAADQHDVAVTTDPDTLESVAFGLQTLRAAERAGRLEVDGDWRLLQQFMALFQVPP